MSGVLGVVDTRQSISPRELAERMARAVSHTKWAQSQVTGDSQVALGIVSGVFFNRALQPVCSPEGDIDLVMAGEITRVDGIDQPAAPVSDEQLALSLYQKYGDEFASHAEGAFVIAIHDRKHQKVILTNDRWGLYPTCYAGRDGRLVFAPEMKAVLLAPWLETRIDRAAMAQYLRWQFLLSERTFFEDVHLLPNAACLVFDLQSSRLLLRSYWDFSQVENLAGKITFEEAVEEATRRLRASVNRLAQRDGRLGLYLTAGLDSRAVLGLLDPSYRPVTLTFGRKDSRDAVFAPELAKKAGLEHHFYEYAGGKWVQEYAPLHLELTEGFHSWIHMHGINILPEARRLMDVNLSGFEGAELNWDDDSLLFAPDETAFHTLLYDAMVNTTTWPSLTEPEFLSLFNHQAALEMTGLAWESFREDLKQYSHLPFEMRTAAFSRLNPDRRFYQYYVVSSRTHIEQRFPFCDYDYLDFMYGLPIEFRRFRRLRKAMIARHMPALAKIPYDKDGLPITSRKWATVAAKATSRTKSLVNRHVAKIFPEFPILHSDYETWLRTDLNAWGADLLTSERTLSRGCFIPDTLRSLWRRQMSGREPDMIGKIAPLMTWELLMRRFVDGETPSPAL